MNGIHNEYWLEQFQIMSWQKRNTVGKDRLAELTELYRSLGFEVKVERFAGPDQPGEACDSCYGNVAGEYFIIYTRKKEIGQ